MHRLSEAIPAWRIVLSRDARLTEVGSSELSGDGNGPELDAYSAPDSAPKRRHRALIRLRHFHRKQLQFKLCEKILNL